MSPDDYKLHILDTSKAWNLYKMQFSQRQRNHRLIIKASRKYKSW